MKTYHQKFPSTITHSVPPSAKSQRAAILRVLVEARGGWVASPQIAALAQQYNARVLELRRLGFAIENSTKIVNGARHSAFRLVASPIAPERKPESIAEPAQVQAELFG